MQEFWIRIVSVMMIVGILFGYNTKLETRQLEDEIARLKAQVQSTVLSNSEGSYEDGVYQGEADGFGGKISLEVAVKEGEIAKITILSADGEDGAYLTMAEDIIDKIIEAQSAEVDTISGATFSSTGIREAAKVALEKAVN